MDAVKKLEDDLRNFRITDLGELLHVFSLRLMMAEENWIQESQDDVFKESNDYLEEALNKNIIEPFDPNFDSHDFSRSYSGYVYWGHGRDLKYLPKLTDAVLKANSQALQSKFKKQSGDVIKMVSTDPSRFRDEFSNTKSGQGTYSRVPILHHCLPGEFVDAWLSLRPNEWGEIAHAIDDRYGALYHNKAVAIEKDWALCVLQELEDRQDIAQGPRKSRIRRIIPSSLTALRNSPDDGVA